MERRLKAQRAGESSSSLDQSVAATSATDFSLLHQSSSTDAAHRLLVVFEKLEAISAAPCQEEIQNALLDEAKDLIHAICVDHRVAAQTFVRDELLRADLCRQVEDECDELVEYIVAAKRFNLEANSRSKDRIVSIGEKLSCKFMTALLKDTVCIFISSYFILFFFFIFSFSDKTVREWTPSM